MFGVGKGSLTKKQIEIANRVAEANGADFAGNPELPGQGHTYWFTTRNLGSPFNERTANAVAEALAAESGWKRP